MDEKYLEKIKIIFSFLSWLPLWSGAELFFWTSEQKLELIVLQYFTLNLCQTVNNNNYNHRNQVTEQFRSL